jgi:ribosome-binding factor A
MSTRQERVKELLRAEISDIIRREVKDPRLGFVTVTDAEISADLRHAKVFISVLGSDEQRADSLKILQRASGVIRGMFAKRANMKTTPEILFGLDASIEQGVRIFELLQKIKREDEKQGA